MLLILTVAILFVVIYFVFQVNRNELYIAIEKNILQNIPPDLKNYKTYQKVLLKKKIPAEVKFSGNWLLAEFFYKNRDEEPAFLQNAIFHYALVTKHPLSSQLVEDAYFNIANILLFELSNFREAIKYYDLLLSKMPDTKWKQVGVERLNVIAASGLKTPEDGSASDEVLKIYFAGEKYFSEGDFPAAIKEFDKVATFPFPGLVPYALYFLGDIYNFKLNDLTKAIGEYEKVVKNYPEYKYAANCQFKIGECLRKKNKWLESIEAFKEFIQKFSGNQHCDYAQFYIGEGYEQLGDPVNARIGYNLLLGNYPSSMWVDMAKLKIIEIEKSLNKNK